MYSGEIVVSTNGIVKLNGTGNGYYVFQAGLRTINNGSLILNGTGGVLPGTDNHVNILLKGVSRRAALSIVDMEHNGLTPAHGPVIEDGPAKIAEYLEHRMLRERQILEALADGVETIPAIV